MIAIVPIVLNLSGDGEFLRPSNAIFTYHTLGNAPELHWLQGACDCATSLLLLGGLMYRQRQTRNFKKGKREEKRQRGAAELSVTDYTLQIRGLPKTTELDGKQLRALFETWGEVVAVSVSRAQRGLLMLLQERDFASVGRSAAEALLLRQQQSMRAQGGLAAPVETRLDPQCLLSDSSLGATGWSWRPCGGGVSSLRGPQRP